MTSDVGCVPDAPCISRFRVPRRLSNARYISVLPMLLLIVVAPAIATVAPVASPPVAQPSTSQPKLDAPEAVRRGNQQLIGGNPTAALESYDHAEQLQPDAREIDFVRGLAHYDLKEYDQAREAFHRAANAAGDALADDAQYSLSTCDHAEALESTDNPELALSLLEDAMRGYHNVLANQPDHTAARDANFKAASLWRQMKQQMEQQQQQQQGQQGDKKENQDEQEKDSSESDQQQENQDQQQDQQSQQSESQDGEQQEEQQQQQSSENQEQQQEEQQASAAQKQEEVSREQAERQLREMMQAMRDRQKQRRMPAQRVPIKAVEKDW